MMDPITAALIKLRRERGLSQWDLARKSGVSRSAIASVEARKHGFSIPAAMMIAYALGYDLRLVRRKDDGQTRRGASHLTSDAPVSDGQRSGVAGTA